MILSCAWNQTVFTLESKHWFWVAAQFHFSRCRGPYFSLKYLVKVWGAGYSVTYCFGFCLLNQYDN